MREQETTRPRAAAYRRARALPRVSAGSSGSGIHDRGARRAVQESRGDPTRPTEETVGRSTTRPWRADTPGPSPGTDYTGAEPRHVASGFLGRAGLGGQTRRGDREPDRRREPSGRGAAVGHPVRRAACAAARPGRVVHELHRERRRQCGRHGASHRQHRHAAKPGDVETRSKLVCTIRQGGHVRGATWLTSHEENAFSEADQATMDAVADMLALAIERTGVRERENLRRDRIESLRQLLLTMAGALDVRQVFPEVSTVIRSGLPHDMLVLTAWSDSGLSSRVYAVAGTKVTDPEFWEPIVLNEADKGLLQRGAYVVMDAATEVPSRHCTRTAVFPLRRQLAAARPAAPRHPRLRVIVLRRARREPVQRRRHGLRRPRGRPPRAGVVAPGARRRRATRRRGATDGGAARGAGGDAQPRARVAQRRAAGCRAGRAAGRTCWPRRHVSRRRRPRSC